MNETIKSTKAMYIDVHAHHFPLRYLDHMAAMGVDVKVARGKGAGSEEGEMARRLRLMDAAGVEIQVLSQAMAPVFDDLTIAETSARMANELLVEARDEAPDRFQALAVLPLPHAEASIAEVEHAFDELGMVGVLVPTSVGRIRLTDPSLEPIWRELDRRGAAVLMHPSGCGIYSPFLQGNEMEWLIGAMIEDQVCLVDLFKSGMPAKYPDIKFIAPHLGGGLSAIFSRIERSAVSGRSNWHVDPLAMAKSIWYDTVGWSEPGFKAAASVFGTDRMLFGTDFPYCNDDEYVSAANYFADSVAVRDLDAIRRGHALELFGFAPEVRGNVNGI